MNHKDTLSKSDRLNNVKSLFASWRANKEKQRRIPECLWKEAVGLYPEYTVGKIASTLSLSFTVLKKRIQKNKHDLSNELKYYTFI